MTKIKQIIEWVREDVNEEESMVWSIFNKALQFTLYVVDIHGSTISILRSIFIWKIDVELS